MILLMGIPFLFIAVAIFLVLKRIMKELRSEDCSESIITPIILKEKNRKNEKQRNLEEHNPS